MDNITISLQAKLEEKKANFELKADDNKKIYKDNTWRMYDANGDVFITKTEQDCINAANPNVGEEYKSFCVECLPSYITDISRTWLIPVTPVLLDSPTLFSQGPRGPRPDRPKGENGKPEGSRPDGPPPGQHGGSGAPSTRGIALNHNGDNVRPEINYQR